MDEYDDADVQFLLDTPEYSDEEWEERPRCNWSYPPFTFAEYKLPGYTCHAEPRWRFLTTYSNASKTDTVYCHDHGIFFHESISGWAMIDHNTKADTMAIDMTTDEVCICAEGDVCAAMEEYRERNRKPEAKVERDKDAIQFWN